MLFPAVNAGYVASVYILFVLWVNFQQYNCCKTQPSSHHKLTIYFSPACRRLCTIASITLCIRCPFLIGLPFSGQLLTVCKCGFDMMTPVERTKWMTSTWDCTLSHGCVYWASRLTKWTALVSVSSLWSFSGKFFNSCCHLPPHPPPLPNTRPPP